MDTTRLKPHRRSPHHVRHPVVALPPPSHASASGEARLAKVSMADFELA